MTSNLQKQTGRTNASNNGRRLERSEINFPLAKCGGEHLVCSPCGKVAGRERCHQLAGPGGAAVALAEK